MAQKIVGYTELEWVCPNCATRNPGPDKTCNGCGAPQPPDVKFQQRTRDELLTDEEKIAAAKAGADIHCPFCGVRNPAGTVSCINCGGDLVEGKRRESGEVLGAHLAGLVTEVTCPHCGSLNPDTNYNCSNCGGVLSTPPNPELTIKDVEKKKMSPLVMVLGGLGIVVLCALMIFLFSLFTRTTDTIGEVSNREWQRSVIIQQFGPVEKSGWEDQIPASASLGACEMRRHHTQNEPAANSKEICGTPYTKDSGSGYGQVVQDCVYEVYAQYCKYTIDDWSDIDTISVNGINNQSYWPKASLTQEQRYGQQTENYSITFSTDDGFYKYTTTSEQIYNSATVGSKWVLEVNAFGSITDLKPQ